MVFKGDDVSKFDTSLYWARAQTAKVSLNV